jgi:hypothetical protein
MGTYTALRFKAKLTPDALKAIRSANGRPSHLHRDFWDNVTDHIDISADFLSFGRRGFIPRGASTYFERSWGPQKSHVSQDGVWEVVCSAKDIGYHPVSMMETFVNDVLPDLISEECRAEIWYEEWDSPKIYEVCPSCAIPS